MSVGWRPHVVICEDGVVAETGWRELRVEVQGRPVFVRMGPDVPGSVPLVHVHGFAISGSYLLPTARALAHRATAVENTDLILMASDQL